MFSKKVEDVIHNSPDHLLTTTQGESRGEAAGRSAQQQNPYLNARRTWNMHTGSLVSSRQTWQVIGLLSLMIALAAVGGMIYIGSQSKFIPYVVEVDKLGLSIAAGPLTAAATTDPRIIRATVAEFIEQARTVSSDTVLQRKALFGLYAHLAAHDPATTKMNEWFNSHPDANPFKRATKELVSIDIASVLPQTANTWRVDWTETKRNRQGALQEPPITMHALVTVYTADITTQTREDQLRRNPLGIFVRDFSWSRLQ